MTAPELPVSPERKGTFLSGAEFRWPGLAKAAHIFLTDGTRSLCNRWFFMGGPEQAQQTSLTEPGSQDCKSCWKRAKKLGLMVSR